ncbi:DUF1631 family protein [Massilia sp. CF038]|uniref:DUF1631 family protein n=1 Tax=Massilia sp. CF038 TaxID=1881045 RepID=UPI0015B67FE0|nr:DUF1631 family protein [Massilia sp. CF038]
MHIPKRIIRLAKERALQSFTSLAEQTVAEADAHLTRSMSGASSTEMYNINHLRTFLRSEARVLRTRMERHFAGLLERAMVTMHVDLRATQTQDIDYNSLALIDDDVLVRHLDVERLVGRLRDAETTPLNRVNLTIAVMHNDREARERENPFRPYLLARALHEALRETVFDETQAKQLFEALGAAMTRRLPGFYAGILGVFEAGGVNARLAARPSAMSRAERERLAWQAAARQLTGRARGGSGGGRSGPATIAPGMAGGPAAAGPQTGITAGSNAGANAQAGAGGALSGRLLPTLERLRELQQAAAEFAPQGQLPDFLDLVWDMFHQPKGGGTAPLLDDGAGNNVRNALDTVLLAMQQAVAGGDPAPAPLGLRVLLADHPDKPAGDSEQTRIMDVSALLFQSIAHDETLSPLMRTQFERLFLPFVRAALMEPELLHQAGHPLRRLIDRLGSLGEVVEPGLPAPALPPAQLEAVVATLLTRFDADMAVFSDAERMLDRHVATQLAAIVPGVAVCAAALAEAAADSARLAGAGVAMSAALQPLQVDPRLADFLLATWTRVLSHPGPGASAAAALLPELLWSAQEKNTPEDRAQLMRMLPHLVRQVREGMASISLPEGPSQSAFDRLVAVHMDVLGGKQEVARRPMTLEQYQASFRDFAIHEDVGASGGWVGGFELEAALTRRQAAATLHAKSAARIAQAQDADLLAWARPGTPFEMRLGERYAQALLTAAPAGDSAFLFAVAGQAHGEIYLRDALLDAMEQGSVRPLENAHLFDRAVQTLMAGAESLSD